MRETSGIEHKRAEAPAVFGVFGSHRYVPTVVKQDCEVAAYMLKIFAQHAVFAKQELLIEIVAHIERVIGDVCGADARLGRPGAVVVAGVHYFIRYQIHFHIKFPFLSLR